MSRTPVSVRAVVLVGLLVSVLVAAVLSLVASSRPDGLEHVADRLGFGGAARDSATVSSPLADYSVRGLDGALGSSLAGVVGVVLTGAAAFALFRLLARRRTPGDR